EVLREGIRFRRACRNLAHRAPPVRLRSAAHEPPCVPVEAAELALHTQKGFGVLDRTFDLEPVAHETRVLQELLDARLRKERHPVGVEAGKCLTVMLPLAEHGLPRQAGLRALEDQELEQ